MNANPERPNIVLILADNLGWGELGSYGGGMVRGALTPRLDQLATEGLRLLNFNVESDCVPTRSALLTGRHPIRTGGSQSVPAGLPQGIHPWEVTLSQLLSDQGYATGIFGKWHLGDQPSRLPTERGFDEWYGIPRTTNESMFTSTPGYDPDVVPLPEIMEGRGGEPVRGIGPFDMEMRRLIDAEITRRTIEFIRRQKANTPFFAYVPITQLHFPTRPHPDFAGKTQTGDFADSLVEMDYRAGLVMDELETLGIAENTLFIFASDNGPEFRRPWRGSAGPWVGTYHTAMEGGLRAPCILSWPGKIPAGSESNQIVHVADLFPTLALLGGAAVPEDRIIDGVDQLDFFLGKQEKSNREGFVYYIKNELRAVKWRDWKMHFIWEREPNEGTNRLEAPYLFNLLQDPKEETDVNMTMGWARTPIRHLQHEFQESLKAHPPIPPGAPDEYTPRG